MFTDKQHQI